MSWARWGMYGSDLYIYATDDGLICHSCRMTPGYPNVLCETAEDMAHHITEHVAHGHHAPSYYNPDTIIDELQEELA